MDLDTALGCFLHHVERSDMDGSYWSDEDDNNKHTDREAYTFISAEILSLRAALDAADRFAKMVKQYAEGSIVTLGDIGQEYEFYQAARALVGKAGGGE